MNGERAKGCSSGGDCKKEWPRRGYPQLPAVGEATGRRQISQRRKNHPKQNLRNIPKAILSARSTLVREVYRQIALTTPT